MSYPSYTYTVIWTNLNTGVKENSIVPENTSSYTVTGLSDSASYNVRVGIASVNICENKKITSDSITVYGKSTYMHAKPNTCKDCPHGK